jgi:cytochrome c oxidase subunit 2
MKPSTILTLALLAGLNVLASLWMGQQAYSWLPVPASAESLLVDRLFSVLVILGTFIFLGITGTLGYAILTQRTSRFDTSDGPPIEGNVTLEIVWTAIPIVLVIIIAGYSYNIYERMSLRGPMELVHLEHMAMPPAYAAEMAADSQVEEIDVIAKQWAWTFHYPKQNVTSDELHLPVDRRVRLSMRSEDVLHGFYVPAFRVKQDILPKRTIDLEFTPIREGKYRLNDSQFSGTYFAIMEANVLVESPAAYENWLDTAANLKPIPAENAALTEYTTASKKAVRTGWATVVPAEPPLVNRSL